MSHRVGLKIELGKEMTKCSVLRQSSGSGIPAMKPTKGCAKRWLLKWRIAK